MSDNDAKDMEDFQDSFHGSDGGELEHKHELINEASNGAEEDVEETIDEISNALRDVDFGGGGATSRAGHTASHTRTIEKWLQRDNLVVYPVWIGNLPRETAVPHLRQFLEKEIGRVLISVHISPKRNANERTYAFLNLPTAEKQILAVTLLDGTVFQGEKLIVRSKRPSKFPQSFFGSSPISDHFKHFRDCVVPAILAAPTVNLNVHAVKRIMEEHNVGLDHLPNRVWCVQCTLTPNCHRTYCSFYHNQEERELGRIISILAAQNCNDGGDSTTFDLAGNENGDMLKRPVAVSRHTLLIEGLPKSVSTQKLTEMFEVFGEIDHVIVNPNNTCFLRMKHSQDARKIVHLLNMNNSGIQIQFAPYDVLGSAANQHVMSALKNASMTKRTRSNNEMYKNEGGPVSGGRAYHGRSSRNGNRLSLEDQGWSRDSMDTDVTTGSMPSMVNQFTSSSAGAPQTSRESSTLKPTLQASHSSHSSHRRRGNSSRNSSSHNSSHGSHGLAGYAGVMPHAPPPPAALFKEDDMPYVRPQHAHQYHSVSSSGYDHYGDDRGFMTPTDYRGYGMMGMGYGTPPTADWGNPTTPTMGYPTPMGYNYPPYYPYHHPNAGLPQLSHMSASDPIPYQPSSGLTGYQQSSHHGYQREQSRHIASRHGRRHLDQHAHYSGRTSSNRRQEPNPAQPEVVPPPPTAMLPMQSMQPKPAKGSRLDSNAVQDILNDIPGL